MKNHIKKLSSLGILLIAFTMMQSFTPANRSSAKIAWINLSYDFGIVEQGIPVSHAFEFTNEGSDPLLISNVKTSCGCTVSKYPKEPIMPGESEEISVVYNSARSGKFNKDVTVMSNADQASYVLSISGEVSPKE